MIQSENYIPQVYRKERTIQVFTKLIDIILSVCKYDIDNIGNVYDANKCPEQLLPLLASTLNYKYNFSDTVTANRKIIDVFTIMEKNRGSKVGLLMATALSLTSLAISKDNAEIISNSDYIDALMNLKIYYDYDEALITIDYPNVYTLVRYLLDYVRPVGMRLKLRGVADKNINTDVMLLYADIEDLTRKYEASVDSGVSKNFVNFSKVGDPRWQDWLETISNPENIIDMNGE
jgi:phage tail-like protein